MSRSDCTDRVECFVVEEASSHNGSVDHNLACVACTVGAVVDLWLSAVADDHRLASCESKSLHTVKSIIIIIIIIIIIF